MRQDIIHLGSNKLDYEIRGVVDFAKKIENLGLNIYWENIGDPINKGEKIPNWMKSIVKDLLDIDKNWGYSPTKGLENTRKFIAKKRNLENNTNLNFEDIIFFNGLGDAISKVYSLLAKQVRVIGPSPAYPTHSSAEAAHATFDQLTYKLDPKNNWKVDIEDLKAKVKYNEMIVGILIINPDNPTGMVYSKEILEEIVKIAKENDLFLISDEIYSNLVYNNAKMISLSKLLDGVPAIIMKGISKDYPWPGARCGWIEFYNREKDENFSTFCDSIVNSKMLEVCSTTLPQASIPKLFENSNHLDYLKSRKDQIQKRANFVYNTLKDVKGLIVNKTYGAFYTSIVFEEGILNKSQKLKIENEKISNLVEENLNENFSLDKRFVYYLLGSCGICVVPLSSFCSELQGFRITLLETDFDEFQKLFLTLKDKIEEYLDN